MLGTAETKRLRSVARKAKKEPSSEQLAKEKTRGGAAVNGALNGHPHPVLSSIPAGYSPERVVESSIREKISALCRVSPGGKSVIQSAEYLRLADLVAAQVWTGEEYEDAADLVSRFGYLVKPVEPIVSPETKPPKRETAKPGKSVPFNHFVAGEAVELGSDLLHEHPDNRESTDSDPDVKDLAESINEDTQLQPIMVRVAPAHWELPDGHFQIVFGERRWRACRVAGLQSVRGEIRTDLDDATTRRLIVIENAKRKDLNPIQKAKLVETLCSPNQDGTQGLTREAAAKHVGLESGSAASNLARLLKLPKVWQQRVSGGELPESFARLLVPYCHAPRLMAAIDASWQKAHQPNASEDQCKNWESRSDLAEEIGHIFDNHTRPIDAGDEFHYGWTFGEHPLRFELTPALEQELEIYTFENVEGRRGKKLASIRRATDCKLYDKHQIPVLRQLGEAKARKSAGKVGRDKPAPKREPTAAENKQAAANRTRQLQARIAAWRDALLRGELIAAINAGLDDGFRLAIAYAAGDSSGLPFRQALEQATKAKAQDEDYRAYFWWAVAGAKDDYAEGALTTALAIQILQHAASDWRRPTVPHALIEAYAADVGVNVAQAWGRLQTTRDGKLAGGIQLEELFLYHRTDELRALAQELGVGAMPTANRAAMVKLLLAAPVNNTRRLPLPRCIKPLAAAKPGNTKRGKGKG